MKTLENNVKLIASRVRRYRLSSRRDGGCGFTVDLPGR
jgi:hypothetical protein